MAKPRRKRTKRDAAVVRAMRATAVRIGERVRELRESQELTLEALAEASVTLNPVHVWKIEKGRLNVELITLVALARGLGVEVGDLFTVGDARARKRLARRELPVRAAKG